MARRWRLPEPILEAVVLIGCATYVACCLLALAFVDDMRNFPTVSRETMDVVLVAFAVSAALLAVPLLRARSWAASTAIVVGGMGIMLFGWLRLTGTADPEWVDASEAADSVVLLVAIGCIGLTVAGIAAGRLFGRRAEARSPRPFATS